MNGGDKVNPYREIIMRRDKYIHEYQKVGSGFRFELKFKNGKITINMETLFISFNNNPTPSHPPIQFRSGSFPFVLLLLSH